LLIYFPINFRKEDLDLDAIIYLIGVQELGKVHQEFKKDEKNLHCHLPFIRALWIL
jgi:hypothetical protein